MRTGVFREVNLIQSRPIKVVLLYVAMSLICIFEAPKLIRLSISLTHMNDGVSEALIDGSILLVTAIMIFLAIKRQLTLQVKSKDQYEMLFDSNPTPMWIYDRKTLKFLQANNTATCIYGYTTEEFRKMSILDITSPDDHYNTVQHVKNMLYNYNPSGNFEHVKKSGDLFTAKVTSHKIYFQNKDCVMAMAEDVTLQHLQDKALKLLCDAEKEYKEELEANIKQLTATLEEKQRLAEVIDRIHNMVIITDPTGVITWVNEAFISTTGYSFDESVGKTHQFLHGPNPDCAMQKRIMDSVKNKDFSVLELINYTKGGSGYWVEMTISPIYNGKKEVVRYISVQNIITQRKLRDVQIQEQNMVLKKLAWTNSHTVRRPIASIISLVELGEYAANMEEIKEINVFIAACSRELDDITKEVSQEINSRNLDGFVEV
jgi:PAS domain S-box-containing protein